MKTPLERGMANIALAAYRTASKNANIDIEAREDLRLVQLIGNATASAGFHHPDGTLDGHEYTAAADLSVRDLGRSQIGAWLECLCEQGFIAFYRNWPGNIHIHSNFAGLPQKSPLDRQNEDFFRGRDGLVGHHRVDDEWWFPEVEARHIPEKMFRLSNPKSGAGRVVSRADVMPQSSPVLPTYALYVGAEPKPRLWMPVLDGVSYAPVRAWGTIMGFDVAYDPAKHSVTFDGHDAPLPVRLLAGVGHAPIRQLAREAGLDLVVDPALRRVEVVR